MKRIVALVLSYLVLATISLATPNPALMSAWRAQEILGNEVWSQVIRIENSGSGTRYPRTVYALVFELVGVLWFYTDSEGTQYLSTRRGKLAEDKAEVGTLLRKLHAGFKRWNVVGDKIHSSASRSTPLPNGCFIESIACLRQRLIAGSAVKHPRILCFFEKSSRSYVGHAVLAFDTADGVAVIDPAEPARSHIFASEVGETAHSLGSAVLGGTVEQALWVPVNDFAADFSTRYADLAETQGGAAVN